MVKGRENFGGKGKGRRGLAVVKDGRGWDGERQNSDWSCSMRKENTDVSAVMVMTSVVTTLSCTVNQQDAAATTPAAAWQRVEGREREEKGRAEEIYAEWETGMSSVHLHSRISKQ